MFNQIREDLKVLYISKRNRLNNDNTSLKCFKQKKPTH